jgi:predicted metal-dependent phosphoesterase TrpH
MDAVALVRAASRRALTHIAITDPDRIDGAQRARDAAGHGVVVIVGQEARTRDGDLIALYVERLVRSGMGFAETAAAIREQGGLVGLAHGFDASRPSVGVGLHRGPDLARLAMAIDYVEVHNGRVPDGPANARAAEFAAAHELPMVAVSDAHRVPEVGSAYTILARPVDTATELRQALTSGHSLVVRNAWESSTASGVRARLIDRLRR